MRLASVRASMLTTLACGLLAGADAPPRPDLAPALAAIRGESILEHIRTLSSDTFEGRGPGTAGEDKTVAYLIERFQALGLKPGNLDGRFVQDVPLVGFRASKVSGHFEAAGKTIELQFPNDWVAVSRRQAREVKVENSDLVFVGYGVVAPEYGWDDYKGIDLRGKTAVMLVNDPPVPDPADPSRLDPRFFKGRAMTYHGRWTYKYEIASEKGAAAAILIHETGPAGYPYEVVAGSWSRENFDIAGDASRANRVTVESWITVDKAKALLLACGRDFDELKNQARRADFRPVALGAKGWFSVSNELRDVASRNVVGRLEGSDPKVRDEFVIYTAHWDHLGRDTSLQGDQIFNGAADNASGVAAVLEAARAFTKLAKPPRRSILFLAVTAEEKGLLGAKYYATRPLHPLHKTLANINMDVINLWGRTRDISSVGLGLSTLDDVLESAAARRGRVVRPDPEPEKGLYYRSDHFEFARQGVPALDPKAGTDYIDKPAGYGQRKRDDYAQKDYHKVSDEVKPDWDLSGAVEDLRLLVEVGLAVAEADRFPEWKPGAEFLEKRKAMLRGESPQATRSLTPMPPGAKR